MNLLICGDICPTESNVGEFEKGNINGLIDDRLEKILKRADFRIANLECPLTDKKNPIAKIGPNLIASKESINGIKALGINFLTLSNNHIMDQDVDGLSSTMEVLDKSNIAYAGAGKNLAEAEKPYIFEITGIKIGIYCCAEHEFSVAEKDVPGANPFEPLYSLDHIYNLKQRCDYVIVLYHGMKEHYRYPTPKLQKILRRIVEKGADLVVCQHNHCIGCEESYQNGKIIYGQGNFIFDAQNNEFWNTGMILDITFDEFKMTTNKPIIFVKKNHMIHIADNETREVVLNGYYERSSHVGDETYIKNRYAEFARNLLPNYMRALSGPWGNNLLVRGLNFLSGRKFTGYVLKKYRKQQLLCIRNYFECECHNEAVLQGIDACLNQEEIK